MKRLVYCGYGCGKATTLLAVFALLVMVTVMFSVSPAFAENPSEWNATWTSFRKVYVQETAGYDRVDEPVEAEVKFFQPMPERDTAGVEVAVARVIRVIYFVPESGWQEVPCQVYDVRPYNWNRRAKTPEIMVRARVVFFATVKARMTGTYYICYGNPDPPEPKLTGGLKVSGEGVGYTIENPWFRIVTDDVSGQVDTIDLKFAGNTAYTFGPGNMHWNPDYMYVPEDFPTTWFKWYYAHNFENPPYESVTGPVFFSIHRSQLVPGQDIAWMEVDYRFYDRLPYFIVESRIVTKKAWHTLAIRNDELAFRTGDFTHAGWRNMTDDMLPGHIGEIGTVDVYNAARVGNHVLGSALPPNMPWVSLCNVEKGVGTGSIRIAWDNTNVLTGEPSLLYNSHTVISDHGGNLYWFRSLVYSQRDDYNDLKWNADDWRKACIDVPEGSSYYEKNAYIFYEWKDESKFEPIDDMSFKLRNPLVVTVE